MSTETPTPTRRTDYARCDVCGVEFSLESSLFYNPASGELHCSRWCHSQSRRYVKRDRTANQPKRFEVGQTIVTPHALKLIKGSNTSLGVLLSRHQTGDWGDVSPDRAQINELSISPRRGMIESRFHLDGGVVIIRTNDARSITLVHVAGEC